MKARQIPTISIHEDFDTGEFILFATSYGQTTPAGARLFRAEPWPGIEFKHRTQEAAERDAQTLGDYLDAVQPKGMSKVRQRKMGAG